MKNKYYGIFGIVFLLLSLVGAYYLTTQNADTRNLAKKGEKSAWDIAQEQKIINKLQKKVDDAKQNADGKDSQSANQKVADAQAALEAAKKAAGSEIPFDNSTCVREGGGIWCGGCGGFCSSGDQTCNEAAAAKCNEASQTGANFITGTCTSTFNIKCTCGNTTVCFDRGQLDGSQCNTSDGLCAVYNNSSTSTVGGMYFCKNVGSTNGIPNSCDESTGGVAITSMPSCFCGVIQVDTAGQGYKSYTGTCGCTKSSTPNDTPVPTPTVVINTPTPTRVISLTPTPTFVITTITPTPTGTIIPSNTPTQTPIPTNTPVPTATPIPPTPAVYACGYTPCDNGGSQCSSGLTCVTANNSAQYCSLPQYVDTCKTNPGYTGCCTAPNIAQGPSPTRIILPSAGFNFPSQALTIVGGIATLLGFLILL